MPTGYSSDRCSTGVLAAVGCADTILLAPLISSMQWKNMAAREGLG